VVITQPTQRLEDVDQGLGQIPQASYRGSTALYHSLCSLKPEMLAGIPGWKVYVVFSDFEDNASKDKTESLVRVAREAGVSIFPVILSEGFGESSVTHAAKRSKEQARAIAEGTGGGILIPKSRKDLPAIFAQLTNDLKAAYHVTYFPSASNTDDKKKKRIRIETTRSHVKLIYPKS
jgi:Ca-activated chloride channel family protein